MSVTEVDIAALRWMRSATKDGSALAIRKRAQITITEIAESIGVSHAAVSRWEHGLRVPRGQAARRYAAALLELQAAKARPSNGGPEVNSEPAI